MKVKKILFVLLLSIIGFIETRGQVSFRLVLYPFEQTIVLENKADTLEIIYNEAISKLHKKDLTSGYHELKAIYNKTNKEKVLNDVLSGHFALTYAEISPKSDGSDAVIFYSIETR